MSTPLTESPKQASDFSLTLNDYIKITAKGLGYGFAALSLYAIPLGTAYFTFHLILD
jgi:hypothetical protein